MTLEFFFFSFFFFFFFFSKTDFDIISIGDNLHEMPYPVFWEKSKKITTLSSAELASQQKLHVWLIRFVNWIDSTSS